MGKIRYTISGTITGRIWMPAVICTKPFKETFEIGDGDDRICFNSIRGVILRVTNDGDFRWCVIDNVHCECVLERIEENWVNIGGDVHTLKSKKVRYFSLKGENNDYSDLFLSNNEEYKKNPDEFYIA